MNKPLREQRIMAVRVCMTMDEYDIVREAAILDQRSMSGFVARAAVRSARVTVGQHKSKTKKESVPLA